jgi:hypothetical protein
MLERRGACRVMAREREGKKPLERWKNNIKMDLNEIGWGWL